MSQAGRGITCKGCGAGLDEDADGQLCQPCPHCGSTQRLVHVFDSDEISSSERAVAHQPPTSPSDPSESIRIAGHGNRSASADVSTESARYDISGDAPRNEEGTLETAQILIQKLRECGAGWTDPRWWTPLTSTARAATVKTPYRCRLRGCPVHLSSGVTSDSAHLQAGLVQPTISRTN